MNAVPDRGANLDDRPDRARPLLRLAEGFLAGVIVGTLEYAFSDRLRGYPLPVGFWFSFAALTAALVGASWLAAEVGAACLPRRFRPGNRGVLYTSLTIAGLAGAHRLYVGGLNVLQVRFHLELFALVAAALVAARFFAAARPAIRRGAVAAVAIGLVAAATLASRSGSPSAPARAAGRTNVLLILIDTLRVDRMSLFGGPRPTTPVLDALAREAFLFRRAYTPSAWTGPSVASIFTGLKSREHGLFRDPFVNRGEVATLPEHFAAHGYDTFGAVGTAIVGPLHGFHRGFRTFHAPVGNAFFRTRLGFLVGRVVDATHLRAVRAAVVRIQDAFLPDGQQLYGLAATRIVSAFDDFLRAESRPFFAYLHFFEPHAPYDAPAPFRGRFGSGAPVPGETFPVTNMGFQPRLTVAGERPKPIERYERLYDEEVLATDAAIGAVIERLRAKGVLDDTLIVLVSDHGEEFFDRGGWSHGHQCFDEIVRGLMMVRFPGGAPRGVSDVPVSLRSSTRLVTDRAGLPPLRGESEPTLERIATGASFAPAEPRVLVELYSVVSGHVPAFAVVDRRWKLVRHGEPGSTVEWLFDLEQDPAERVDLSGERPEIREELSRWLDAETQAPLPPPEAPQPELLDPLRALGYVG